MSTYGTKTIYEITFVGNFFCIYSVFIFKIKLPTMKFNAVCTTQTHYIIIHYITI